MLTNSFLIKYPEAFQYYGVLSAALPAAYGTLTPDETAALQANPSGSEIAGRM